MGQHMRNYFAAIGLLGRQPRSVTAPLAADSWICRAIQPDHEGDDVISNDWRWTSRHLLAASPDVVLQLPLHTQSLPLLQIEGQNSFRAALQSTARRARKTHSLVLLQK